MGAILCALSNVMYLGEKFAMWVAMSMVMTCFAITLIMMLGMGIGLGYNYCFVDIKTKHRYIPGHYEYRIHGRDYVRRTMLEPNNTDTKSNGSVLEEKDTDPSSLNAEANIRTIEQNNLTEVVEDIKKGTNDINTFEGTKVQDKVNEVKRPSKTVLQIDGLDLMTLLSKLKVEHRNYSLQIVTD